MSAAVTDTSPLFYLILLNLVDFLTEYVDEIWIPTAVARELSHASTPEKARAWINSPPDRFFVASPREGAPLGLDRGETEAIWLAEQRGISSIFIDERRATRVARERGLAVAGTMALLEHFAFERWINYDEVIDQLRQTSFRMPEKVVAASRARLGLRPR